MSPNTWENRITLLLNQRFWVTWFIVLIIVFLVHLITLTISSLAWIDEVQTIEYGRLTLEPHSDWSLNWTVHLDRPILLLSYLGATLQELAFRASNLSMIGPRVTSLLGGMIASTVFLGYLLSRKTPKRVAWLLASIFLLEPMFVHSYRGVRVDCWVFALCFGSCWLLRLSINRIQKAQISTWLVALAGSLAAVGIFVWPSAILLYPLVIAEFVELIWRTQAFGKGWKPALTQIIAFVLGGTITASLLVIPIWQHLTTAFGDLQLISSSDRTLRSRSSLILEMKIVLNDVLSTYKNSLLLPIVALIGIIYSRDKKLILSTLFVIIFLLCTKVYTFRAVYLLPYILCLVGSIYQSLKDKPRTNLRRIFSSILILLLIWSFVLSLIVRPATALSQKEGRNPSILYNAGFSLIGAGSYKVYVNALELYYPGRSLGWKMFFPFDLQTLNLNTEQRDKDSDNIALRKFFSHVDFAIISPNKISHEMIHRIEAAGLQYQKTFVSGYKNDVDEKDSVLLSKAQPYGPYILYGRH